MTGGKIWTTVVALCWIGVLCAGIYAWRKTEGIEYVNERVVTCTITEKESRDLESFPPVPAVDTAQCGRLTFQLGWDRATVELFRDLDTGHTYRLRVADIRPIQAKGAMAIVAIEGEK